MVVPFYDNSILTIAGLAMKVFECFFVFFLKIGILVLFLMGDIHVMRIKVWLPWFGWMKLVGVRLISILNWLLVEKRRLGIIMHIIYEFYWREWWVILNWKGKDLNVICLWDLVKHCLRENLPCCFEHKLWKWQICYVDFTSLYPYVQTFFSVSY